RVVRGPWENGHRPGIDTLFRSAARWWTTRAIGIVLSGALDDGAAGLVAIHDAGGVALVQDPHEAAVPDMPLAALETGVVDATLRLKELAARVVELSENAQGPPEWVAADDDGLREIDLDPPLPPDAEPAGFVCPDCGGSLFEFDADSLRLRCRVGHGWTGEALREANHRRFEEALWTAVRVLEEDVALQERMASRARAQEHHHALARIERRLAERARLLEVVRTAIAEGPREEDDLSADAHG
ncbi:MAG: two-component system, chemotaxis family, protein-glutamate methylesterase/glutaminase, partial [Actinomycetota bacterium]|nr:two-component system, chemotaxis family, protein-glutamate methylesterase/glutaminase [Actinomycetota bacterium]